ncbi:hypothetical protein DT144_07885 [Salmonella enterica subsp. enterica]|nr:hypothetical protein [Salmonella enterica subsp. enterica]
MSITPGNSRSNCSVPAAFMMERRRNRGANYISAHSVTHFFMLFAIVIYLVYGDVVLGSKLSFSLGPVAHRICLQPFWK